MDLIVIINQLNSELWKKNGETAYDFSVRTNSFYEEIYFGDLRIWDSENGQTSGDPRKQIKIIKKAFRAEMKLLKSYKI